MINKLIEDSEKSLYESFKLIDDIALRNQNKVLKAFQDNKIALRHFAPTTGYGYDDIGRDGLGSVFAQAFDCECALVSPLIASGTHAISTVLFGLLRPNDLMLSISGMPYDTLESIIFGQGIGSLKDFEIKFDKIELSSDGTFDVPKILDAIKKEKPKVLFIQRSRGYSWRNALSLEQIGKVISKIRKVYDGCIAIDNCYGEFVEDKEPTSIGADIIVGSLIKNPGGGLAPSGGYIAGKKQYVEQISYRLTAPGVGSEIGSYAYGYQYFYQGLFLAPHTTAQALKTAKLFGCVFDKLGYETLPAVNAFNADIISSIKFKTKDELIKFCQAIQACSPIDSHVTPYPWDMPGYSHQVIMAAGTFVQGASIELSADAPIKEPYVAYLQGALTYEHGKLALIKCLESLNLTKL